MIGAKILGVYNIRADELVCLIELELHGNLKTFKIDEITQEDESLPRMNWQVAYDEQWLERRECYGRIAFFFHRLDQTKPLLTSFGPLTLPDRTEAPGYLEHIRYMNPC